MPLLLISYMLQFFDKTTLGYTAILGIQADTVSLLRLVRVNAQKINTFEAFKRNRLLVGLFDILLRLLDCLLPCLSCLRKIPSWKVPRRLRSVMGSHPHLPRRCYELRRPHGFTVPSRRF